MLGILDLKRKVSIILLIAGASTLVSCARENNAQLVSEPGKYESTIPWNRQEQWEQEGSGQISQLNTR
jgi:hypothetical protein